MLSMGFLYLILRKDITAPTAELVLVMRVKGRKAEHRINRFIRDKVINVLCHHGHPVRLQALARTGFEIYSAPRVQKDVRKYFLMFYKEIPPNLHFYEKPHGDCVIIRGENCDIDEVGNPWPLYNPHAKVVVFDDYPHLLACRPKPKYWKVIHRPIDTDLFRPLGLKRKGFAVVRSELGARKKTIADMEVYLELKDRYDFKTYGTSYLPGSLCDEFVPHYETPKLYNQIKVGVEVVPDNVNFASMEMMACETPVVHLRPRKMRQEVIIDGYNGFLPKDLEEMCECIDLLLKDEKLRRLMGQRARNTILGSFNVDQYVISYRNLIEKVWELKCSAK